MKQKEEQVNLGKSKKTKNKYYCEFCDVKCKTKYNYNRHLETRKHKMKYFRAHEKSTGLVCYECKLCFNSYSTLHRHKKIKHYER